MHVRTGRAGRLSLKARVALATAVIFLVFIGGGTLLTIRYFMHEYREATGAQQFQMLSAIAQSIDNDITNARFALSRAALIVPDGAFTDRARAQRFLDDRFVLRSTFDDGLLLVGNDGVVVAESPTGAAPGRNIADLAHFQAVRRTGSPTVSAPYASIVADGRPAVAIAVPVFGMRGEMLGQLHGSIEVLSQSFLGNLFNMRVGQAGYLFVLTRDRQIVIHPDTSRILQAGSAIGVNTMMDRAVAGFEGSGETVNSLGIEQVFTFKHLSTVPWIVGSAFPSAEAYGPFNRATRVAIVTMAIGAFVVLLAGWLTMRHFLAPLERLTVHIRSISSKVGRDRLAATAGSGEVAALAEAFNAMIVEADRRTDALAASEAKAAEALRNLDRSMAAVDEMVTLWNDREELVFANAHWHKIYERVSDRIGYGTKFADYAALLWDAGYVNNYPKTRAEFIEERLKQFRGPGGSFTRLVAPGKWLRMTEAKLPDGWTATASTDISDLIRHEIELTETNQRLAEQAVRLEILNQDYAREREAARAANEAKTQFLANMSHELRTPLNAIIGFSEVLEQQMFGPLSTRYHDYSRDILSAGRHLLALINDILDLSRIEVGRYEVVGSMVDVADPINGCVTMMRERIATKRLALEVDVDSGGQPVFMDPRIVRQTVLNLLSNAAKFTPEHGRIRLWARVEPNHTTRIVVADSGIGMSRDAVQRAFDPFWQAEHAYHRRHEGTGLGHAITKRLVELHGGSIAIDSAPGSGTTVTIVLPELEAVHEAPPKRRAAASG